ncbi:hypothetical protein KUL42_39190 [Alteromonas sp. KUL42]|uniref:hypothetical protein n=1 Tax=Alteromonas sp. KUL42 TaxID=2480797 RepID=UPI001035CFB4|nr:hypothetical protein [Alteromonas sp. KUL42]TAP31724.1 hypothetical protein EYR97_19750 [Alteromonas sp. KUL42]GEA09158.1 hypothetical protein KUL42_39190 [Alteromonas sp. KUL42]
MSALDIYLMQLRNSRVGFVEGIEIAKNFVLSEGGEVSFTEDGEVVLFMQGENAYCFQLFPDIDRFYYEI